jgi:hypothetical protein
MGMAQSLLKLAGLDWQVPDFSTVSRRQKHLAVTIEARPTTTIRGRSFGTCRQFTCPAWPRQEQDLCNKGM